MKKLLLIALVSVFLFSASTIVKGAPQLLPENMPDPYWGDLGTVVPKVTILIPGLESSQGLDTISFGTNITYEKATWNKDVITVENLDLTSKNLNIGPVMVTIKANDTKEFGSGFLVTSPNMKIQLSENTPASQNNFNAPLLEVITDVHALNQKRVVACSTAGALLLTLNRGVLWNYTYPTIMNPQDQITPIDKNNIYFSAVDFNGNTGFAVGAYLYADQMNPSTVLAPLMFKTIDGGNIWTRVQLPITLGQIALTDVFIARDDPSRAWVTTTGLTKNLDVNVVVANAPAPVGPQIKNLLYTTNGGQNWTPVDVLYEDKPNMELEIPVLGSVAARNNGNGYDVWVVGGPLDGGGVIKSGVIVIPTTTTTTIPPAPKYPRIVYKSTDSGLTFPTAIKVPPLAGAIRVQAINANTLYLTGMEVNQETKINAGYIFKSTNGGLNWTNVTPDTPFADLFSGQNMPQFSLYLGGLSFRDVNNGYVVGMLGNQDLGFIGLIYSTDSGGKPWKLATKDMRSLINVYSYDKYNTWMVGGNFISPNSLMKMFTGGGMSTTPGTISVNPGTIDNVTVNSAVRAFANVSIGGQMGNVPNGRVIIKQVDPRVLAKIEPNTLNPKDVKTVNVFADDIQAEPKIELRPTFASSLPWLVAGESGGAASATLGIPENEPLGTVDVKLTNEDGSAGFLKDGLSIVASGAPPPPPPQSTTPKLMSVTPTVGISGNQLQVTAVVAGLPPNPQITTVSVRSTRQPYKTITFASGFTYDQNTNRLVLPPFIPGPESVGYNTVIVEVAGLPPITSNDRALMVDINMPDFLAVYPNPVTTSALRASQPAAQSRIAFTVGSQKPVTIVIIDPSSMTVVFKQSLVAKPGYNEVFLGGRTASGTEFPIGSYIVQLLSGNKVDASVPFVIIK